MSMNTIQRNLATAATSPIKTAAPTAPAADAPASAPRVELKGSNCPGIGGCQRTNKIFESAVAPQKIQTTIVLKRPQDMKFQPRPFDTMSREEFAKYGAKADQIDSIQKFAKANGLSVDSVDPITRTVKLSGTQTQYNKAFGVNLGDYKDKNGNEFRGYEGNLKMPKNVADNVSAVLGLQTRPAARPHTTPFQRAGQKDSQDQSYTPTQVASMYNFPKGTDGSGQTIAIIELGGGYNPDELKQYFQKLGIDNPDIQAIGVDGASNAPTGSADGPDGEVVLDCEVAGSIAPKAKIRVYFAPNTDQGFVDAVNAAVHDKTNPATQVSISWGGPEDSWSSQATGAFNDALKDAAALGVNVFVASGDNGSSDGETDGQNHVDFPGSSPYAISTGGTNIQTANGQITGETVWNEATGGAGGGGFSTLFPQPDWQKAAGIQVPAGTSASGGRGVPDVSGDADPASGYDILVDGEEGAIGGTSAVAPLWAALTARLQQGVGAPIGYLNPKIYQDSFKGAFNDITQGNNGSFSAGPGWDAATGLGSPDGEKLLAALKAAQASAQATSRPAPAQALKALAQASPSTPNSKPLSVVA